MQLLLVFLRLNSTNIFCAEFNRQFFLIHIFLRRGNSRGLRKNSRATRKNRKARKESQKNSKVSPEKKHQKILEGTRKLSNFPNVSKISKMSKIIRKAYKKNPEKNPERSEKMPMDSKKGFANTRMKSCNAPKSFESSQKNSEK